MSLVVAYPECQFTTLTRDDHRSLASDVLVQLIQTQSLYGVDVSEVARDVDGVERCSDLRAPLLRLTGSLFICF
jgi:hypothetical protein